MNTAGTEADHWIHHRGLVLVQLKGCIRRGTATLTVYVYGDPVVMGKGVDCLEKVEKVLRVAAKKKGISSETRDMIKALKFKLVELFKA